MFAKINPAYLVATLFFLTSGCYLYLCALTCTRRAYTKLLRDYLIVGVLLAVFSLLYGLMTIADNKTLLRFCWAGGFIAGCLFYPRWVIFLSNMVSFQFRGTSLLIKAVYALTILFSLLCVCSRDVVFVKTDYGNQFSYPTSPLFLTIFVLISFLTLLFMVLHVRWWREAEMERHRKQAFWFIVLAILIAPIGFITDYVLPIFTDKTVVPLGSVSLLIASIPIFFFFFSTQTLSITVSSVSGYIFNSVTIPTLILDHKNTILLENESALEFLGRDVVRKNIADIIVKDDTPPEQSFFDSSFTSEKVRAQTRHGIKICDMLLTVERDKYHDTLCKVVLIRDITKDEYNCPFREFS
jgi:PAS domain-containing protein